MVLQSQLPLVLEELGGLLKALLALMVVALQLLRGLRLPLLAAVAEEARLLEQMDKMAGQAVEGMGSQKHGPLPVPQYPAKAIAGDMAVEFLKAAAVAGPASFSF